MPFPWRTRDAMESIARGRVCVFSPAALPEWRGIVYVACATLCFNKYSFDDALRTIAELEFNKIDVAIHESCNHLRPSQVAQDPSAAAAQLRMASGLVPSAISVEI